MTHSMNSLGAESYSPAARAALGSRGVGVPLLPRTPLLWRLNAPGRSLKAASASSPAGAHVPPARQPGGAHLREGGAQG